MHLAKCKTIEHVNDERKSANSAKSNCYWKSKKQCFWERKKKSHSLIEENECTSNATGVKRVSLQNEIIDYIVRTTHNEKKDLQIAVFSIL